LVPAKLGNGVTASGALKARVLRIGAVVKLRATIDRKLSDACKVTKDVASHFASLPSRSSLTNLSSLASV
jgi:hypothetical protein